MTDVKLLLLDSNTLNHLIVYKKWISLKCVYKSYILYVYI